MKKTDAELLADAVRDRDRGYSDLAKMTARAEAAEAMVLRLRQANKALLLALVEMEKVTL